MNILMAAPYFYPKTGGMENYALNIAQKLVSNHNSQVTMITSLHDKQLKTDEDYQGIRIIRYPIMIKASNTPMHPLWYSHIKKHCKENQIDIVHAHTPVPFMADMAIRAAKDTKTPVVYTYHNDLVKNSLLQIPINLYYSLLGKSSLAHADAIINTTASYAQHSPYLHQYQDKIEVIPPSIDPHRFSLRNDDLLKNMKSKKWTIVFVSQMAKTHQHRGLHVLLNAIAPIKEHVRLIAVGDGDFLPNYKKIATQLRIDALFPGFVKDEDLPTYYAVADCVCLPSINRSEGYGMVLLEGGYMGKALIGSDIGGISSVIDNNITGLLVKPGSEQALTNAIMFLIEHPSRATAFGNAAAKKFKNQTWDTQAQQTFKLYQKVISQKSV